MVSKVSNLKVVNQFPHYRDITNSEYLCADKKKYVIKEQDPLTELIFAPDPHTGIPRSDLALVMSKDCEPEVAQFIQNTLMRAQNSSPGVDDPDFALDTVRNNGESLTQYAARLKELCNPKPKK